MLANESGPKAAEPADGAGCALNIPVSAEGLAGYVVPSRITRMGSTKLFFRVKRPVEQARLVISSGGEVIFAGKPRGFKPSIMESAPLTAKILERTGGELTLSIEPIEEL